MVPNLERKVGTSASEGAITTWVSKVTPQLTLPVIYYPFDSLMDNHAQQLDGIIHFIQSLLP